MVDGALGDSESLAGLSEEIALVKSLILLVMVVCRHRSGIRSDLSFSRMFQFVDSIYTSCGNWGHLLNLGDQPRRWL